jgi:hypothetical protein
MIMKPENTRREFLAKVGSGMLIATVGYGAAVDMGLSSVLADDGPESLKFGPLEPLVDVMQSTAIDRLLPLLAERLQTGTDLRQMLAAAALANARTFGGEDYVGFHTMMALAPAYHMAMELPEARRALPVFKVLYRNTQRIQEFGGRKSEVLHPVEPISPPANRVGGEVLREAVRRKDMAAAEGIFAALAAGSAADAFNHLLLAVQDNTEVHRVVLPYRAWDLLELIGKEHAHTLLRQSVRYCVKSERDWPRKATVDEPRSLLPKLLDGHHLLGRTLGTRQVDDGWVDEMSQTIFTSTAQGAAEAAAAALADGIVPSAVGEAISLAANQLVLRDAGRRPSEVRPGKPAGSVHGDSIGVHACDSANAWRNMVRASNPRNAVASMILGAYQVALDRVARGGDFLHWQPWPVSEQADKVRQVAPDALLPETESAIRANDQARACALVHRYGELGRPARPVFDLLLRYAVSEDGALHAEKYYRTVAEEFASTRPPFRWRQLAALARVTASEYGRPAPGYADSCKLLGVQLAGST